MPPELCQGNYDFCLIDSTQLCRVENYNATTSYIYELSYLSPEQVEILCGCGRKRQLYVDVISVNGIFSAVTDLCCHHHQQHCIIVKPMTHLKVFFRKLLSKENFQMWHKGCMPQAKVFLRKLLAQVTFARKFLMCHRLYLSVLVVQSVNQSHQPTSNSNRWHSFSQYFHQTLTVLNSMLRHLVTSSQNVNKNWNLSQSVTIHYYCHWLIDFNFCLHFVTKWQGDEAVINSRLLRSDGNGNIVKTNTTCVGYVHCVIRICSLDHCDCSCY